MVGPSRNGRAPYSVTRPLCLLSRQVALQQLLLLCCAASLAPVVVSGQMSAGHVRAEPVDWGSPRVVVAIVLSYISIPIFISSLVLLRRRRLLYPIASRGSSLLVALNAICMLSSLVSTALHVAFPLGLPCAMHALVLQLTAPFALVMLTRGYLLVFRVEILNYLAELAWRQNKAACLRKRMGDAPEAGMSVPLLLVQPAGETETSPRTVASPTRGRLGSRSRPDPLSMPSMEPASIPGHFFITRRRLTQSRFIGAALGMAVAAMALPVLFTALFDIDVKWTDEWRRERGLADDTARSHFAGGNFFEAPRCLLYSMKMFAFIFSMSVMLPIGAWIGWRILLNSRRMEARAQEQAEFEAALRVADSPTAAAAAAAVADASTSSSAPAVVATRAVTSVADLDELSAVKIEMGVTVAIGTLGIGLYVLVTETAYSYTSACLAIAFFLLFCNTCLSALHRSFVASRRYRQALTLARNKGAGGKEGKRGRLEALVPHHRPLYRLAHVIADPHAYPVLLKFLQKEFSSENALFYIEARRFARECRAAERVLPGWSSSLDEDDSSHTDTASSNGHVRIEMSRVAAPATPAGVAPPSPLLRPSSAVGVWGPDSIKGEAAAGDLLSPTRSLAAPHAQLQVQLSPPLSGAHCSATRSRMALEPGCRAPALARSSSSHRLPVQGSVTAAQREHAMSSFVSATPSKRGTASSLGLYLQPEPLAAAAPALDTVSPLRRQRSLRGGRRSTASAKAPPAAPPLSFRQMHELALGLRTRCLRLYDEYLRANAVYQVNIDSDLAKMVAAQVRQVQDWQPTPLTAEGEPDYERAAMESAPPTPPPFPLSSLYQQTALSVFTLMETDSFRRFLLTADFQSLLQRADDQEMERLERQSGMAADTDAVLAQADAVLSPTCALLLGADLTLLPGIPTLPSDDLPARPSIRDSASGLVSPLPLLVLDRASTHDPDDDSTPIANEDDRTTQVDRV